MILNSSSANAPGAHADASVDSNVDIDIYAFDRDSQLFSAAPELVELVQTTASKVFGADLFDPAEDEPWGHYFAMGSKGSGVHFHHHPDGWAYLFEGSKRWFFLPPNELPPFTHEPYIPMKYW